NRTWATARVVSFLGHLNWRDRVEVTVGDGDRLEYVLKKFRRQITKAGLFQDMKRKRFYESPGALRRRKDKAAARRKVKSARRREQHQVRSTAKMARITALVKRFNDAKGYGFIT